MIEAIDIEQLLTWAYREELAKRETSSAEAIWEKLADYGSMAVRVDFGQRGPQRYDHGTPHPDAIAIEREVASLPDAVIDWQREAYSVLGTTLALVDPTPQQNASAASARPTRATWRNRSGQLVEVDLQPPRDVIAVRTLRTSALVTMHAKMGTRPDWLDVQLTPHPVPANNGPHPKLYGECYGKLRYSVGACCPLRWEPSPIAVVEARSDYLAWWRGLRTLAIRLRYTLSEYSPTRLSATEMPWNHSR